MTPEQLLTHLTNQQNVLKSDIREMIMDSNIAIHGKIIDEVENLEGKIDTVIVHQEKQNGELNRHREKLVKVDKDLLLIKQHPKNCIAKKTVGNWKLTLFFSIILIAAVNYLLNTYTWLDIIELIKKII